MIPIVIRNEQDILMFSSNQDPFLVPVFLISNVTGSGLNRFKRFIKMIPLESYQNDPLNEEAEFIIQSKFLLEDNKIVVCGWVYSSQVSKG
jgi:GTPase